jgi:hypothetical protein
MTYANHKVREVMGNRDVGMGEVLKSLPKIFSTDETEIMSVFEDWADEQAIIMSNKVTDYKYTYYKKFGVELPPSELDAYVIGPEFIPTT